MDAGAVTQMPSGTLRSVAALSDAGLLARERADGLTPVAKKYAIAVTPDVVALIEHAGDAIARQFVPREEELVVTPEERADPIGDAHHSPVPGIVHRHKDRVLFMPVLTCPVYCRFCFRREHVGPKGQTTGSENVLSPEATERALAYVAARSEIREVILTGGDPLILTPRRVADLSHALATIPHVRILRWHTRVPAVDPSRITDDLVAALIVPGATTYVALHANHPREFSREAKEAIARLIDAGIPMLSQSVLLKGVNDDVETLETLMNTFIENRIKPYYLHHPDLAPGTSHFRIPIAEGRALMRELRTRLSGLSMPEYVLDIPGGYAKVSLLSDNIEEVDGGRYRIRDHAGRWHVYPPEN